MEPIDDEIPGTSASFKEVGRGCRAKKKMMDPVVCPVCSCTVRPQEIDSHYYLELERLSKVFHGKYKQNGRNSTSSPPTTNGNVEQTTDNTWDKFQKVRLNRQNRQKNKTRKRRHEEVRCPICNEITNEDINQHVENCLRKSENQNSDSDEIDVEVDEDYERVRVTELFTGSLSNLGTIISGTEEDEDLVVDEDDTQLYGTPQYSEKDIIVPGLIDKEQDELRKAVIGSVNKNTSKDDSSKNENEDKAASSGDPLLEALKNRIRELESKEHNQEESYKCLICMERYKTPVISVCCWHVHCEVCWLQTLGAKKLCPQCNMITSPSDLRRIYM